jgi:ATP/maltotriose-dependent transcriptional regulator MalT
VNESLAPAWAAFRASDWEAARAAFEAALETDPDDPEAHEGLSRTLFMTPDRDAGNEHRRRAYQLYRARGEARRAAGCAIHIGGEERVAGRPAAWRAWLARADGLLEAEGPCAERGWLAVDRAKAATSPDEAAGHAEEAVAMAQAAGDADLEACARSQLGLALVSRGEVERGMELIDEAMTAATGGEATDPFAIGDTACTTLVACDRLSDLPRASEWARFVVDFTTRRRYTPLAGWCRSVYAGVLTATGDWERAEQELGQALADGDALTRIGRAAAVARLAELRVRQGRLEEAERLLGPDLDDPLAVGPATRLALARGDVRLAAELLDRALAGARGAGLAALLPLAAEVRLAEGDLDGAVEVLEQLRETGRRLLRADLVALAELVAAGVSRARGDGAEVAHLETALDGFRRLTMPLEEGRARLELARALAVSAPELAGRHGRAALEAFERLGAALDADEAAAFLRGMGDGGRAAPRVPGVLTARERQVLGLLAEGCSNAEIARRLFIAPKTAEHHVGRILGKLGLRNRAEAAAYVLRAGGAG